MELKDQFLRTREETESICAPLQTEDYVVQPMVDVSPPKWHLAHTTWFFEQFILVKHDPDYQVFNPDFAYLFNSYYNHMGERTLRQDRGFMTRPSVAKVYEYRNHVTAAITKVLENNPGDKVLELVEVGINHEQQHQELLAYDIKYILGTQPTFPSIGNYFRWEEERHSHKWLSFSEGLYEVGHQGNGFCFDNELPVHKVYLENFDISNSLVTNGEFLEFMEDGGYRNFDLWHDEGWHFIRDNAIEHPLYWHFKDGTWQQFHFNGLEKLNHDLPVSHISMYEAYAFASWKGMRLPTEFEWEVAAGKLPWGQLWEWTNSAYLPYPGFTRAEGALGEYNGKFMLNQMVLRGASVATPDGHERSSYRNFFHASSRWVFSGIRLVKQ
ncbi:ergothioneine biosynthesis protein EgtB [Flagellimonas lutimaris]|uniref:ergothioneine biosynthesis protein EgtB n=1 Tax=Flagellimonas lutimaris TaxID=475082 RepID=UPI000B6DDCD0|nr:MAG: ergothioneine biosynthesis protein EgtB [Muricauda sp. TMED12]|tara:strand:+ start:189 stop:1337 length:1149 start_codon:yes stop_codon:yes gene_type:complete